MSLPTTQHDARTRWSLVATLREDPEHSADALAALAREYWFPVYAYVRRQGHASTPAFALTSAFFSVLTSRLMREPPDAGMRFRLYLINQLQAFLALGGTSGGVEVAAPYSQEELEHRLAPSAVDAMRPQAAFDRDYAGELMARALSSLREEARGRIDLLEQLLPLLAEDPLPGQCEEIAKTAGVPALAISVALKRLRQRFRELIDEQLARTVGDERGLPEERRALLNALSGPG